MPGHAGDHKGLCWRMKQTVECGMFHKETNKLNWLARLTAQKGILERFPQCQAQLHFFFHSPTESKGPPRATPPPSPLRIIDDLFLG